MAVIIVSLTYMYIVRVCVYMYVQCTCIVNEPLFETW